MAVFQLVDPVREKYISTDKEFMVILETGEISGVRVNKQYVLRDWRGFYKDRDKSLEALLGRNDHSLEA